ncbi:hypothetical protein MMPV_000463 [Pyropia vietnamensis]
MPTREPSVPFDPLLSAANRVPAAAVPPVVRSRVPVITQGSGAERLDAPDGELREQPRVDTAAREPAIASTAVTTPRGTKRSRPPPSSTDEQVPVLQLVTSPHGPPLMDWPAADTTHTDGDPEQPTVEAAGGALEGKGAAAHGSSTDEPASSPSGAMFDTVPSPLPPAAITDSPGAADGVAAAAAGEDKGSGTEVAGHLPQLQPAAAPQSPPPLDDTAGDGGHGGVGAVQDVDAVAADVLADGQPAAGTEEAAAPPPATGATPPQLLEQLRTLEVLQSSAARAEQQLRLADEPLSAIRQLMSAMLCLLAVSRRMQLLGGAAGFRHAVLAQGIPRAVGLLLKRFAGFRRGALRDAALRTLRVAARLVVATLPLHVPEALDILGRLTDLDNYGAAVLIVSQFGRRGGVFRSLPPPVASSLDTSPLLGDEDADIGDLDDDDDDDVEDEATALALAISRRELSSFDLDPAVLAMLSGADGDKNFVGPLVQPPSSMASFSSAGSEDSIGVPPAQERSRVFDNAVEMIGEGRGGADSGASYRPTVTALAAAQAENGGLIAHAPADDTGSWPAVVPNEIIGPSPAGVEVEADATVAGPLHVGDGSPGDQRTAGVAGAISPAVPALASGGSDVGKARPSRMDVQPPSQLGDNPDMDVDAGDAGATPWDAEYVTSTLYSTTNDPMAGAVPDANDAVAALASVVNVFGRHGGFDYILSRLRRGLSTDVDGAGHSAPRRLDQLAGAASDSHRPGGLESDNDFLTMHQVKAMLIAPHRVRLLFAPPRVDADGEITEGKLSAFAAAARQAVFCRVLSLSDEELKNEERTVIDSTLHLANDLVWATRAVTAIRRNDFVYTGGPEPMSQVVRSRLMAAAAEAELRDEQEVQYLYMKLIVKRLRSRFLEQRLIGMADLKAKVAAAVQAGFATAAAESNPARPSGEDEDVVGAGEGKEAGPGRVDAPLTVAETSTTGAVAVVETPASRSADGDAENVPPARLGPLSAEPQLLPHVEPGNKSAGAAGVDAQSQQNGPPNARGATPVSMARATDVGSLALSAKPIVTATTMCAWLNDAGIVEMIFDRGRLHAEVIKRSSEVIQFLAGRKALSATHIDTLWAATRGTHESVAHTVYSVLAELPMSLQPVLIDRLWCRIRAVPAVEYDTQLVQLVSTFTYRTLLSPMLVLVKAASHRADAPRVPSSPRGPAGMDCGGDGATADTAVEASGAEPELVGPQEWFGVSRLWDLIQDGQGVADAVFDAASASLHDFLLWDLCESRRKHVILGCIANLERHTSQPQSIQLLCALISAKSVGPSAGGSAAEANDFTAFLRALDREVNLVQVVVVDYEVYSAQAVAAAAAADGPLGPGTDLNVSRLVSSSRPGHLRQVLLRLQLLALCITHSSGIFSLRRAQVDVLWGCSVERAVTSAERDAFFSWLCFCCPDLVASRTQPLGTAVPTNVALPSQSPPSTSMTEVIPTAGPGAAAVPVHSAVGGEDGPTSHPNADASVHTTTPAMSDGPSVIKYIFFEKLRRMSAGLLTERAALCAEVYFRVVNWEAGRLLTIDAGGAPLGGGLVRAQTPFTIKPNSRQFSFECVSGLPVSSNFIVLAPQLLGIDVIWALALDAGHAADGARASAFLLRLYLRHAQKYSKSTGSRLSEFVSLCMKHLSTAATGSSASPAARQRAGRCILLLRAFLDEFDAIISRAGLAVTDRRHSARTLGKPLSLGVIIISEGRLQLACHSNDSLGALRARIAAGLNALGGPTTVPPTGVRIITAGKELRDDARTLGELRIIDQQQLHVARRVQPASSAGAGATVSGGVGRPGGLPEGGSAGSGGVGAGADGDAMEGAYAGAASGALFATVSAADLVALDSDVVPRRVLSRSPYFDHFFQLMEAGDEDLSTQLWELLMRLPTNEATLEALQNPESVAEWRSLLDAASPFRVHYALQIIDSLCQSPDVGEDVDMGGDGACTATAVPAVDGGIVNTGSIAEKDADNGTSSPAAVVDTDTGHSSPSEREKSCATRSWRIRFVSGGGLTYLLEVLQTFDFDSQPWRIRRRSCLTLLLKIVNTFLVSGSVHNLSVAPAEPPELVLTLGLTLEGPALQALMKKLLQMSQNLSPCVPSASASRVGGGAVAPEHGEDLIVVPVVSLVVAAARSSPDLLRWFCSSTEYRAWLYSILLRCADERRREAAALSVRLLASLSAASRGDLFVLLFDLLDSVVAVDASNSYMTTEYFALLTELVQRCFRDSVLAAAGGVNSTLSSTEDGGTISVSVAQMQMKRLVDAMVGLPVRERRPSDGVVDKVLVGLLEVLRIFLPCCKVWGVAGASLELPATVVPAWGAAEVQGAGAASSGARLQSGSGPVSTPGPPVESMCRTLTEHLHACLFGKPTSTDHGPLAPPKCKTHDTRSAAFRLLLGLTSFSPAVHAQVVDGLLQAHRAMLEARRSALRFCASWPGLAPSPVGGAAVWNTDVLVAGQLVAEAQHYPWVPLVSSSDKAACGFVGLKNLGTTCYMNSLLQQLFMIPRFRTSVLRAPIDGNVDDSHTLAVNLQLLFSNLLLSEKRAFDTRGFCLAYKDSDGRPINTAVQMDVDEFLNVLFDKLEKAVRGGPYEKLLEETFCGKLVNQIICRDLPFVSERQESFYVLSLDVKDKRSVLDSLDFYVQGDVLDGDNKYFCSQYDQHVVALKRTCLGALPHTLILHLKRFEFDFDTMRKVKINDYCEFPAILDMAPYTKPVLARRDASSHAGFRAPAGHDKGSASASVATAGLGGGTVPDTIVAPGRDAVDANASSSIDPAAGSAQADTGDDTRGLQYRLVGMLVHAGTADSGHYYSFVQERGTDRWIHFNDTVTELFDPADIPRTCYGGVESVSQWDPQAQKTVQWLQSKQHSAYMLFYERIGPPPGGARPVGTVASVPVQPAESDGVAVGTGDHDVGDGAEGESVTMDTAPAPGESGGSGTCGSEESHGVLGTPGGAPNGVTAQATAATNAGAAAGLNDGFVVPSIQAIPAEVFRRVWNENALHFYDKHRLDPDYDAFLMELISHSCRSMSATPAANGKPVAPDPDLILRYAQVGLHFLLDGLARTKDKVKIASWCSLLDPLLQHVLASRWFLGVCVTEPFDWPLQLLVRCPHPETRKNVACLLQTAVLRLRTAEMKEGTYLKFAQSTSAEVPATGPSTQDSFAFDGDATSAALREDPTKLRATPVTALGGAVAAGSTVAAFVDALLSLLPVAYMTGDWKHLAQMFSLLTWFATLGATERGFLLRRRVMARVLDLYLGDESPYAPSRGDLPRTKRHKIEETNTQDVVRALLPLVSLLTRSMDFGSSGTSPVALPVSRASDDSRIIRSPPSSEASNGVVVAAMGAPSFVASDPATSTTADVESGGQQSTVADTEDMVTSALPALVAESDGASAATGRTAPSQSVQADSLKDVQAAASTSPTLPTPAGAPGATLVPAGRLEAGLLDSSLFWSNALRDDLTGEALAEIAVHLGSNSAPASRVLIDSAIRGLNDANYPSFPAYFTVLRRLLTDCDDSLRSARVSYMMHSFVVMVQDNQAYKQATLHAVRFVLSLLNSTNEVTLMVAEWLVASTYQWLAAWLLWCEHPPVRMEVLSLLRRITSLNSDLHRRVCAALIGLLPVALAIAREASTAHHQATEQTASGQLGLLAAYLHALHVFLAEEGSHAAAGGATVTPTVENVSGDAAASPEPAVFGLPRLLPHLGILGEILRVVDLRRLPCDESQLELISLLRALAAIDGVPLLMARQTSVATSLRSFFIFVHQGNEALMAYNMRVLPLFYEVLERCCRADHAFVMQLVEHGDMTFALLYIYLAVDYVQVVFSHMPSLHTVLSFCTLASASFRSKQRSAVLERLYNLLPSSVHVANAGISHLTAADASLRFLYQVLCTPEDGADLLANDTDSNYFFMVLTILAEASTVSAETLYVAYRAVDIYYHAVMLQALDAPGALASRVPCIAPSLLKLLRARPPVSRAAAIPSQRISAYNLILASLPYRPDASAHWVDVLQEDSERNMRQVGRGGGGGGGDDCGGKATLDQPLPPASMPAAAAAATTADGPGASPDAEAPPSVTTGTTAVAEEVRQRESSRSPGRKSPSSESRQQLEQLSVSGSATDAGTSEGLCLAGVTRDPPPPVVLGTSGATRAADGAGTDTGADCAATSDPLAAHAGGATAVPATNMARSQAAVARVASEDAVRESAEWQRVHSRLALPVYSGHTGYDLLFIASVVGRFAAYCTVQASATAAADGGEAASSSPPREAADTPRRLEAASRLIGAALLNSIEKEPVHVAVVEIVSHMLADAERVRRGAAAAAAAAAAEAAAAVANKDGPAATALPDFGCDMGTGVGGSDGSAAAATARPASAADTPAPAAAIAAAATATAADVSVPPVLFCSPAARVEPILLFYPRLALRARLISQFTLWSDSVLALVQRLLRAVPTPSAAVDSALPLADLTAIVRVLAEDVACLVRWSAAGQPRVGGGGDAAADVRPRGDAACPSGGGRGGAAARTAAAVASTAAEPPIAAVAATSSDADIPASRDGDTAAAPAVAPASATALASSASAAGTPGGGGNGIGTGAAPPFTPPDVPVAVAKRAVYRALAVLATLAVVVTTGSDRQRAHVAAMRLGGAGSPVAAAAALRLAGAFAGTALAASLHRRAVRVLALVGGGDGGYGDGGGGGGGDGGTPAESVSGGAVDAPPPSPPPPCQSPTTAVAATAVATASGGGDEPSSDVVTPAAAAAATLAASGVEANVVMPSTVGTAGATNATARAVASPMADTAMADAAQSVEATTPATADAATPPADATPASADARMTDASAGGSAAAADVMAESTGAAPGCLGGAPSMEPAVGSGCDGAAGRRDASPAIPSAP